MNRKLFCLNRKLLICIYQNYLDPNSDYLFSFPEKGILLVRTKNRIFKKSIFRNLFLEFIIEKILIVYIINIYSSFTFFISILMESTLAYTYENTNKQYRLIIFNISRYGKYQKTIKFARYVTEQEAIRAAEKYLSVPVSNKYYRKIRDDLFIQSNSFKEFNQHYKTRGDCLSDAKMIKHIQVLDGTTLVLHCGA